MKVKVNDFINWQFVKQNGKQPCILYVEQVRTP